MGHWESIGKSDEWFTPKFIFDELGCVFDMDVAHPKQKTNVPAFDLITEFSLDVEWNGFVWMNPPFGGRNGIVPWMNKFLQHANGIALVPDRTSAPWFQKFASKSDLILFVSPKIKFEKPDGSVGNSPGNGTALIAIGEKGVNALLNGKKLGIIVRPEKR